jgi:hypothetical protein
MAGRSRVPEEPGSWTSGRSPSLAGGFIVEAVEKQAPGAFHEPSRLDRVVLPQPDTGIRQLLADSRSMPFGRRQPCFFRISSPILGGFPEVFQQGFQGRPTYITESLSLFIRHVESRFGRRGQGPAFTNFQVGA